MKSKFSILIIVCIQLSTACQRDCDRYIPNYDIPEHSRSGFVYDLGEYYNFSVTDSLSTYNSRLLVVQSYYNYQKKYQATGLMDCGINQEVYKEIYYAKLINNQLTDSLEIAVYDSVDYRDYYRTDVSSTMYLYVYYNGKEIVKQGSNIIESQKNPQTKLINNINYTEVYSYKAKYDLTDIPNVFSFNKYNGILEISVPKFSISIIPN